MVWCAIVCQISQFRNWKEIWNFGFHNIFTGLMSFLGVGCPVTGPRSLPKGGSTPILSRGRGIPVSGEGIPVPGGVSLSWGHSQERTGVPPARTGPRYSLETEQQTEYYAAVICVLNSCRRTFLLLTDQF